MDKEQSAQKNTWEDIYDIIYKKLNDRPDRPKKKRPKKKSNTSQSNSSVGRPVREGVLETIEEESQGDESKQEGMGGVSASEVQAPALGPPLRSGTQQSGEQTQTEADSKHNKSSIFWPSRIQCIIILSLGFTSAFVFDYLYYTRHKNNNTTDKNTKDVPNNQQKKKITPRTRRHKQNCAIIFGVGCSLAYLTLVAYNYYYLQNTSQAQSVA